MLKLLFIRHGESTGNRDRRMAGHQDDGLTPLGHHQCHRLALALHQRQWRPSHIYTSPLRRSVESLTCLLKPWPWQLPNGNGVALEKLHNCAFKSLPYRQQGDRDVPGSPGLTFSTALAEFQAGVLTGLTWPEARRNYPDLCSALETQQGWVPIPGAETPLQGQRRAQDFIQQVMADHANGDTLWILSHHWILEHLVAALLGSDRTWQLTIPNTAVFEFWIDRDRWLEDGMPLGISDFWQIKRFSDCSHLELPTDLGDGLEGR